MTKNVCQKSKITKSKIFIGFSNVPFNAVVFVGFNANCAEASTNGAKHKFGSHAELVCVLRQTFFFICGGLFALLFSHKKVGRN
jgi:hypothetical protein